MVTTIAGWWILAAVVLVICMFNCMFNDERFS